MKRLFLILLAGLLLASCAASEKSLKDLMEGAEGTGADQKLTALSTLDAIPDYNDKFYVVDASGPTSLAILYQYLIGARTPIINTPDSWSMTTSDYYGGTMIASGDGEMELADVAVGMFFTTKARAAVTATGAIMNPDQDGTADTIYLNGTALTQGEAIKCTGVGVCVWQYAAANTWSVECSANCTEETP